MNENQTNFILSFRIIRILIGISGTLLPILLISSSIIQRVNIQLSISSYYHTNMRDLFVGILCSLGLFLICYKGYNSTDNKIMNIAGILAFGIAFFPTKSNYYIGGNIGIFLINPEFSQKIHVTFATLFFLIIAYISYFLFTKSNKELTDNKKIRNRIYKICGIIIILSTIACFIFFVKNNHVAFILFESIILFSFGVSWLIKGKSIKLVYTLMSSRKSLLY